MEKDGGDSDAQIARQKEKRVEEEAKKEFGDICNPSGVKTWIETKREGGQ